MTGKKANIALTNGTGIEGWLEASKNWRIFAYVPGGNLSVLTEGIQSSIVNQTRNDLAKYIVRNRIKSLRELAKY